MTTTRIYRSTDAGAPVLSGAASKLIDLLDACLVNGYNAQTITITRSGSTATATCTAHGYLVGQVVLVSGATQTEYNGEFRVTAVTSNDFTFEVTGTPATPATGTISCIQAPAGWTKPYTGTNKAAFKNSVAAGGSGMLLRVLEDGSGTGGQREALCRAYATMSDVDTGTAETPTVAQLAASIIWRKSNTVDSTARAWVLIADELTMYLCVETGTTSYGAGFYGVGDFASEVAGDGYPFFIFGRHAQAGASSNGTSQGVFHRTENNWTAPTATSFWLARGHAGTGSPIGAAIAMPAATTAASNTTTIGGSHATNLANPSPGGSNEYWVPAIIGCESTLRGTMRGLHMPLSSLAGVASGTDRTSPSGRPSGSVVTIMRHHCNDNDVTGAPADAHAGVESALEW